MSEAREFFLPFVKKEKVANETYSFYFDPAERDFDFLPGQYVRMTLDINNPDNRGNLRSFTIASSQMQKSHIMVTTKAASHSGKPKAHPESLQRFGYEGKGDSGQARMTSFETVSSFKRRMLDLASGEKVKFFGPMGGFVLNEEEKNPRVFLAGGIGITPFQSMITYVFAKRLSIPITLIVSFSVVEDLVFYNKLTDIAKKNPYIKVVYTVSHPE
ncbi:MAG: FAD-dependent oxidoreductase [Patescibacteria group bacterium]